MKWPLLPRSSLEQQNTLSSRNEVVEWRGGWWGPREIRWRWGFWWGSEGSQTETVRVISSLTRSRLAGYTCQMWRTFQKWMGGFGGGGVGLAMLAWDEGKKGGKGQWLLLLATPTKLFLRPHTHTHTSSNTHKQTFRLNSHFFLPHCHSFLPTRPYLSLSHTRWQIIDVFLDQQPAAAGVHNPVDSHTHTSSSLRTSYAYTYTYSQQSTHSHMQRQRA